MSEVLIELHDAHIREWERAMDSLAADANKGIAPDVAAEAVQSEGVPPIETTEQMLNRVFANGPIHDASYDQAGALRRNGRKRGESAPANATAGNSSGCAEGRKTVAQTLIGLGEYCMLFHDDRGDAYATASADNILRTLRLRGREFRRWLCGRYYAETGKAANGEAIASALAVLEAKAIFDGPVSTLYNRFAEKDGVVYIDLCDHHWRVIKVTADGWEVLKQPPVLFRRHVHQQPLPEPVKGGRLAELRAFLNLGNEEDQRLTEAWLVTAPFAESPRPALDIHGPQGAAKSTVARVLKSLLDPSATDFVDLGRDPAALAQVLDHNAVPCFDNLARIPSWASDMLCKGVTGGGFSKRELYTDAEDVILSFKRALIVTGINIPTHAPDLLDRMLLIELERVSPERRRDERAFWVEFEAARPRMFGAVLDAIVGVLRHRDRMQLNHLPRMADFALLACAHAEHAGVGKDKMMKIIMDNAGRQTQEIIESDSLAMAVRDFAEKQQRWEGTASELLVALTQPFAQNKMLPEGWPKSAKSLGRRLKVLHTTLVEVGIALRWRTSSEGKSRLIEVVKGAAQTSEMSETSEATPDGAVRADVSSGEVHTNVGETSGRNVNGGGSSDKTDISDISSQDPTEVF